MKDSVYHSLLRVASLTLALVLLFESGLLSPVTKQIADEAHEYMGAAVGASASVKPNEVNELTAKIAMLEKQISDGEDRQIAVGLNTGGGATSASDVRVYILSVLLFVLLVLIVLNYVLDYLRRQEQVIRRHEQTT